MQESPRRLRRLSARPSPVGGARLGTGPPAFRPPGGPDGGRGLGHLRAVAKAVLLVLWTVVALLVQAVCILLPGRPKLVFPRLYWRTFARVFGVQIQVIGTPAQATGGRRVVYVSNHSSWLDIPILGGTLEACFISKDDVARWPLVSTVAKLGRTVFVSRQRGSTARERDVIRERLAQGDNLVLFPEGTTSDGSRVLPFRSSFFAVAEGELPPLIQPVSVVQDRLSGLPTGRVNRPLFAYYGDMHIGSHFWRLAHYPTMRATILLHEPLDPATFPNRKSLAAIVWSEVADGAALLRQNRPVASLARAEREDERARRERVGAEVT